MLRQERRPSPASFIDHFGPGIMQRARTIVDWNDPANLRNGWYFSDVLSLNTPNPFLPWFGMVILASDGRGIQKVWSHAVNTAPIEWAREFHYEGAIPVFGEWTGGDTGDITAILGNGFVHYDTTDHGPVHYARLNGVTYLGGTAESTVSTTGAAFVLPPGFRPYRRVIASVPSLSGARRLDISPTGAVSFPEGSGVGYVSFALSPFPARG